MIQAHGYTPTLVYLKASAAITKHMAVSIVPGGTVEPSSPTLGPVLGFALESASGGASLPVQTDGIIYDYEGPAGTLRAGYWYSQGTGGNLTIESDPTKLSNGVGVAIDAQTFQIRFLSVGGSSGGGVTPTPTPVPAPVITSASLKKVLIGSTFTYEITATGIDGPEITDRTWSLSGNPSWLTLNQSFHTLVGTVPDTIVDGSTIDVEIGVTTNGGSATKTLTLRFLSELTEDMFVTVLADGTVVLDTTIDDMISLLEDGVEVTTITI